MAILRFWPPVAIACQILEFHSIKNYNTATLGPYHSGSLQHVQRNGYARSLGGYHHRHKFVCQVYVVAVVAVMAHQKPPCEAGLDALMSV